MPFGQYSNEDQEQTTSVQQLYQQNLAKGMDQKDAAKDAQARTGQSLVTGRPINKQVEFSATGKVGYSGQYPGSEHTTKRWKPAAWPS